MSTTEEKFLKDYTQPDYTIEKVQLHFELFEEKTIVTNTMDIVRKNSDATSLVLDTQELELLSIKLNDKELTKEEYSIEEESVTVFDTPASFELTIENIIYPHKNTELEGLYKSGDIFCTQCEPEGFRRITPYLDRPDVMAVFTTTVVADKEKYPILLSNGNKHQCHESFDGRHAVTWHDPHPKPSYLFALVAGDLECVSDSFTTMNNKEVALNIYVDKGNGSKTKHAMSSLKNAMAWDEVKYGREYDLDIYNIVAVDSFNMGAMENKGLNIFNSAYVLADTNTATDANFMGIESVIAHEYFHNWTGNRITCRDWFQLTLKEGLTVFRDQCFSGDMNSKEVQRIEDVRALRERQFVEDASPTRHPIQPKSYISMNNFYTATVYEKGAEVIRMLYTLLGEENYRKATDLYFEKFDGMAVTVDDFLWAMKQYGSFDLKQFKRWYDQSGTPKLRVEESFENGVYTLTLTQVIPDDVDGNAQLPYYYPLKMALLDNDGATIVEKILIVSKEQERFVFENLNTQPVLSINRDFSAPIIVEQENPNYPFLMQYDTNGFMQYEATQKFALATMQKMVDGNGVDDAFIKAYGTLLDADVDLSLKALLLALPTLSSLMQTQQEVDFEVLHNVKEKLSMTLASTYKEKLLALYHDNHFPKNDALDAVSMAQRSVKNRVLLTLSSLQDKEIAHLAHTQYQQSVTMTDKIIALDVMEHFDSDFAKESLEDFYNKYKDETLVMNKYFALLASADKEDILERIESLQKDAVYDEKVPNLVRALIGSFTRNYKHFHAKDGSGYRFVANKMAQIDKINPQMAASLAGAFKNYQKLNEKNKQTMADAIECVVSTHQLSKNVLEILDKIFKK